jgi:myo-inositol-1(or 4)-monophosphatase
MPWTKERAAAEEAARAAGELLARMMPTATAVISDEGRDIKTQADHDAEATILALLEKTGYPVLAEESGAMNLPKDDSPFWVIDPLDGTLNFSRGLPLCTVSVALMGGREALVGVIYDFNRDECFSAAKGQGATLNGVPMHVSRQTDPKQAICMTGTPTHSDFSEAGLRPLLDRIQRFKKVRLLGSAALMLACVAAGRADAYAEDDIMLWDVAAGLCLIEEAGGQVRMEDSDRLEWGVCVRCAGDLKLFE